MITSKTTNELLKILSSMDTSSALHDLSDELEQPKNKTSFPDYLSKKMQEKRGHARQALGTFSDSAELWIPDS